MRTTLLILSVGAFALGFAAHAFAAPTLADDAVSVLTDTRIGGAPFGDAGDLRAVDPAGIPKVFTDPAGDNEAGQAPDVTTVTVDNDGAGLITMTITVANRTALTSADAYLVFFDADRNPATGDVSLAGAEYAIVVDGSDQSISLARWDGSAWQGVPPPASLNGHWAGGPVVQINRSDLGNTAGFNFIIGAFTTIGTTDYLDIAPNGPPPWQYILVLGGPGDCTLAGTAGDDVLNGTAARDVICGLGGNDRIRGGAGNDVIRGGDGGDSLFGEVGDDVITGGPGGDVLVGADGRDRLLGEAGGDRLEGGAANDALLGGGGGDRLLGHAGADTLTGGGGRDTMLGYAGNDTFYARDGVRDVVNGGAGTDRARLDRADVRSLLERRF
jgi:Ca2+-binding RTX toxin-like protein